MRIAHILISLASGALGFLVGIIISPFFESTAVSDLMPYLMAFVFFYITLDHFIKEWTWGESEKVNKLFQ